MTQVSQPADKARKKLSQYVEILHGAAQPEHIRELIGGLVLARR
jgi:hypothetical protein